MFSACGYSNKLAFQTVSEDDFSYVEEFTRTELLQRLTEKCSKLKIDLKQEVKRHYFGDFVNNTADFKFNQNERNQITKAASKLIETTTDLFSLKDPKIIEIAKKTTFWFSDDVDGEKKQEIRAPDASKNLLSRMLDTAAKNELRPKQGYRYDVDFKRFCVYNRVLSGRMPFNALHLNLKGCLPSISTTNRYIHRTDHAVIEGELRVDELLNYLEERQQPMWVCLSEDGTRVENRIQYDSRTNQVVGFVLPTDQNGMPVPLYFKARTADEIVHHFSQNNEVAQNVITVMAKPIGNAPAICILVFGTDNRYPADVVSSRWTYITQQLNNVGINVASISSDSAPTYNAAMRKNSQLGQDSDDPDGLFKCGQRLDPPFYFQDYPHIITKMRGAILKTIKDPEIFPFGNYFVQLQHLEELLNRIGENKHLLTATCLRPADRQNVESAQRICDPKVINLLKKNIKNSEGTVIFLEIMSDMYSAFHDRTLEPVERLKKTWRCVFLVRIWRDFILKNSTLTLKNNFISSFCYHCIEQNAHSLVLMLLHLKKNKLTHLFLPYMFCSQPCESFYRQVRSLTTVNSTVVNFSVKEIIHRISRIQLLSDISNDKDSGFIFPETLSSCNFSGPNFGEGSFPTQDEIIKIIQKCKGEAVQKAVEVGLIETNVKSKDQTCVYRALPYKNKKKKDVDDEDLNQTFDDYDETHLKNISTQIKNYAAKFEKDSLIDTSSYVELYINGKRHVFKKTSLCFVLSKESYKCSSDRKFRVRNPIKSNKKQKHKPKSFKIKQYTGKKYNLRKRISKKK